MSQEETDRMMDGVADFFADFLEAPMRRAESDLAAAIAINAAAIAAAEVLVRMGKTPGEAMLAVEAACRRMADKLKQHAGGH